jgi:hypothetical protein
MEGLDMSNQIERYILQALQIGIRSATSLPTSIPVKYVNTNFDARDVDKWWEVVYIPNNIENQYWDSGKTYRGILRLILHCTQNNTGAYDQMDIVDTMANAFKIGSIFEDPAKKVRVKITSEPTLMGVIEESPNFLLPLTIRYECFKI